MGVLLGKALEISTRHFGAGHSNVARICLLQGADRQLLIARLTTVLTK